MPALSHNALFVCRINNVISVLTPICLLLTISPQFLEHYLNTTNSPGKSLPLPVSILFITIIWHFFRSTVLRLHDLNLSGYWAVLATFLFFGSQNISDIAPALSYGLYITIRIIGLLLLIGLIVWPGTEGDNLYGVPSEPPPFAHQAIAIGTVTLILLGCLYQIATSHMQYINDKARNNIELSENEIQYLFTTHRPILSANQLQLAIDNEEQELGEPIQDREAFQLKLQQQLDEMRLAQFRTLQHPLLTPDIPEFQRPLVTEKALDQYLQNISAERGERQNREVARRELQQEYDKATRKKLGLRDLTSRR